MPAATAKINDTIIADSDNTLKVEGNHYFPVESVHFEFLTETDHTTVCHWKGNASYYTIQLGDEQFNNAAWTYHEPTSERAQPLKDYVAFYSNIVDIQDK